MDQVWQKHVLKIGLFTGLALIAFAANSVLARSALGTGAIDAGSFTVIRLASGAVFLFIIVGLGSVRLSNVRLGNAEPGNNRPAGKQSGSWMASFMLFTYAITFSFAYITLDTGTGALILFGAVQITMILVSLFKGTRLQVLEWVGLIAAFSGFVYLILPGLTTPTLTGFGLMTVSGIAWGLYTLSGRKSTNPLADTAYNFLRTLPFVGVVFLIVLSNASFSMRGVILAILSGGIASGVGYTLWYTALGGLSATQAAVLQLLVPVIAAVGGVIFIAESITARLVVSATFILAGILLVVLSRRAPDA